MGLWQPLTQPNRRCQISVSALARWRHRESDVTQSDTHEPKITRHTVPDTPDGAARIQLKTIEHPGGFSFAGSLHGRLDCPRICPSEIPEFLQLLENIIRSSPLSIVEYYKSVHSNAFGTKVQNMNLAIKVHPIPEGKDGLGSMWQRLDLLITENLVFHEN
jgi:hypothetical protein